MTPRQSAEGDSGGLPSAERLFAPRYVCAISSLAIATRPVVCARSRPLSGILWVASRFNSVPLPCCPRSLSSVVIVSSLLPTSRSAVVVIGRAQLATGSGTGHFRSSPNASSQLLAIRSKSAVPSSSLSSSSSVTRLVSLFLSLRTAVDGQGRRHTSTQDICMCKRQRNRRTHGRHTRGRARRMGRPNSLCNPDPSCHRERGHDQHMRLELAIGNHCC